MNTMKRMAVGIAFVAMLALTLVSTGGQAYAGGGKGSQTGNSQGTTTQPGTGNFQSLGVSWE